MRRGVVRAQTIEYRAPLVYPDAFVIETWLARLGRTSHDFGHRLVREGDGQVLARTRSTIVQVGPEGPAPLDPSLSELVEDREAPVHPPMQGVAPDDAYRRRWVVRPSDQDSFRHQNQARYFDAVEDTLRLANLEGHAAGFEASPFAVSVTFDQEVHAGTEVEMGLWVTDGNARRLELRRTEDGAVLAQGWAKPR
jgi:acyl-CoA thioesterase FadM